MTTFSPRTGLLPLTSYEPAGHSGASPPGSAALNQLSLDDLLAEAPRAATPAPRAGLERRKLHRLLTAFLEMYAGRRPVSQLGAWLTPALQHGLRVRARASGPRYTLRKVHVCRPADGVMEVCGTAHAAGRAYAVTARFQHESDGWRCAAFAVLEPRASR